MAFLTGGLMFPIFYTASNYFTVIGMSFMVPKAG
jgi:hypothetical protein